MIVDIMTLIVDVLILILLFIWFVMDRHQIYFRNVASGFEKFSRDAGDPDRLKDDEGSKP